jgi:hypothetical protein
MPHSDASTLTTRQQAWFATLKDGLVRDTGRTLDQWAEIARATCPETRPRARLLWMKETHGLGQNRASVIMETAFPAAAGWDDPDALADTLWADPAARALFEAAKAAILELPDVIVAQRKGFTPFSRNFQFAAMRPVKQAVLIGLAVPPEAAPGLVAPKRVIWSERLKSETTIVCADDIAPLRALLRQAWEAS